MKALFYLARFSDILWWILIFAIAYDAYGNPMSRMVLLVIIWRWMTRGLYIVHARMKAEREGRSNEYGSR